MSKMTALSGVSTTLLDETAVDAKKLATNFGEIAYDCYGMEGATLKSELIRRFPLTTWLLNTSMARTIRSASTRGLANIHRDAQGDWILELPRQLWTLPQTSANTECCWQPFDFAKCAGNVPLKLLCLKDCDSVFDSLVYDTIHIGSRDAVEGVAGTGESLKTVNKRVARMSMAFLSAMNAIQGMDDTYTDILKPFHGMLEVMNNPAVTKISVSTILAAFDEVGCRLDVLQESGNYQFACNPVVYRSIEAVVRPGINGELPYGWTRNGDTLTYHGIGFLQDKWVPVDMTAGTGDVWLIDGDTAGLFLATDLAPTDAFTRESGVDTSENNCGAECDYYYNFGTAFATDANKLAVLSGVPINSTCLNATADLKNLIVPNTLIPNPVA